LNLKLFVLEKLLLPFLLSILMTGIISAISILSAVGIANFDVFKWLHTWLYSWVVAFPTVLVVLPIVKKYVEYLVKRERRRIELY